MVVDAGTLTEPTDNAAQWVISEFTATGTTAFNGGIAAYGPGTDGTNIDPKTGAAFATLADIPYWPINQGTLFISKFTAAGAGALPGGA